VELTAEEVRVLGALVEKETTTPEAYPLSTNGLVLACNQRSSRDPVVEYDERTVTATMLSLRERGLARTQRGEGSRVYKHAHTLGNAFDTGPDELAVLSVLMLRGPQTIGELRTRTERQHAFASLDAVDSVLRGLAERESPLVRQLPRQPGQKEARWRHVLGGGEPAEASTEPSTRAPEPAGGRADTLAAEVAELRSELAALREEVARLRSQMDAGEPAT